MEEAYGLLYFSISPNLIFHVEAVPTHQNVWNNIEGLHWRIYELVGHQLENDLISSIPCKRKALHEFFSKLKPLNQSFKVSEIDRKEGYLILLIISKIIHKHFGIFLPSTL